MTSRTTRGARRRITSLALAASVAAVAGVVATAAQAKQTCSTAAASQGYWSWRMIDGRKCWYEGKPKLSKSELAWPAQTLATDSKSEPAGTVEDKRGNPMDAQAYAPAEPGTFDALWHDRIEPDKR
jgi:hypothetical protein